MDIFAIVCLASALSCLCVETNAEDLNYLCVTVSNSKKSDADHCDAPGTGVLVSDVIIKNILGEDALADNTCEKLYTDDEDNLSAPHYLTQKVANQCNGKKRCLPKGTMLFPQDSGWSFVIIAYTCIRIASKEEEGDLTSLALNIRKASEILVPEKQTVTLSMRITPKDTPINRTCHASGNDVTMTVTFLHLDLRGKQNDVTCYGNLQMTSQSQDLISENCSETGTGDLSPFRANDDVKLAVSMKEGFIWLQIQGSTTFTMTCGKTKIVEARIQPIPELISTSPKPATTAPPTTTPATTTTPKTTTPHTQVHDTAKVLIAIISVIAIVANSVVIALVIYLCKTRNSPYLRWKLKREASHRSRRMGEPETNMASRRKEPSVEDEYACVDDGELDDLRTKDQQLPTPAATNLFYANTSTLEVEEPTRAPTLTLPLSSPRLPTRAHHEPAYFNNHGNNSNSTVPSSNEVRKESAGAQAVEYSHVAMVDPKDAGVKIYSPGFYHKSRNPEAILPAGGDTYDVVGASSGEYCHLADCQRKKYLKDNLYDG